MKWAKHKISLCLLYTHQSLRRQETHLGSCRPARHKQAKYVTWVGVTRRRHHPEESGCRSLDGREHCHIGVTVMCWKLRTGQVVTTVRRRESVSQRPWEVKCDVAMEACEAGGVLLSPLRLPSSPFPKDTDKS